MTGSPSLKRLAAYGHLATRLGPRWALSRARNALDGRLGLLERRLPSRGWTPYSASATSSDSTHSLPIVGLPVNRAALEALAAQEPPAARATLADDLAGLRQGRLRYFSGQLATPGWPPDWHQNVPEARSGPAAEHFSRIATYGHGDIKHIWEPGRFAFTWTLARAAAAGLAPDAGRLFFEAVASFVDANPPFDGPQWMCGQESTFRALAVLGGWSMFHADATQDDATRVVGLLLATADRIEAHIDYALSQRNNHGLSEACGLLLIGAALPRHPRALERQRQGARLLEAQAAALVYDDGGFSQHSANYHRVMMQVLALALGTAESLAIPLPATRAALGRAAGLARALVRADGTQARYGHDDGALILPWTSCSYDDFRPAIQEALAVLGQPLAFAPGPWDAGVVWLGRAARLEDPRDVDSRPERQAFHRNAGIAQLSDGATSVQMRVPTPRHRPSHLDTLHVDVWWHDVEIAIDLGTYAYNAPAPFADIPFATGPFHNVVHAPGNDQADRIGRFLFWPWPAATLAWLGTGGAVAEYRGALGPIRRWQRAVAMLGPAGCIVTDRVDVPSASAVELRWHLADLPDVTPDGVLDRVVLSTAHGPYTVAVACANAMAGAVMTRRRAVTGSADGWRSRRYQALTPCWDIVVPAVASGTASLFFVTAFTPGDGRLVGHDAGWQLHAADGVVSSHWWPAHAMTA